MDQDEEHGVYQGEIKTARSDNGLGNDHQERPGEDSRDKLARMDLLQFFRPIDVGIWVLLWRRNVSRQKIVDESQENEDEGYEMGFMDVTDKNNIYFRVSRVRARFLKSKFADKNTQYVY